MRLLKNILIIIFVLASIWVVKDDAVKFFNDYIRNIGSTESNKGIEIGVENNIEIQKESIPAKAILPGPLVKIIDSVLVKDLKTDQGEVVTLVNKERVARGLKPYTVNVRLNNSAKIKADDMIAKNYFEHISPSGKSVSDLVKQTGYDYLSVGENLAKGNFSSSANLVEAWMNSPGHRANILNSKFTEIGVSIEFTTENGRDILYAVQHFGLPRSACGALDENLKKETETLKVSLSILEKSLIEQKTEIDNYGKNKLETKNYNELVDAYNQSIKNYNLLVGEIKIKVSKYNAQVSALNACVEGL